MALVQPKHAVVGVGEPRVDRYPLDPRIQRLPTLFGVRYKDIGLVVQTSEVRQDPLVHKPVEQGRREFVELQQNNGLMRAHLQLFSRVAVTLGRRLAPAPSRLIHMGTSLARGPSCERCAISTRSLDLRQPLSNQPSPVQRMPLAQFLDLGPAAWDGLAIRCPVATPFMQWTWHRAWANAHYVAAKHALEGMVRAVAVEYPSIRAVIVRPPKLHTDQTNANFDFEPHLAPTTVAKRVVNLVSQAGSSPEGDGVTVVEF